MSKVPYMYSFWQIFHALSLFPAQRLFRTLVYYKKRFLCKNFFFYKISKNQKRKFSRFGPHLENQLKYRPIQHLKTTVRILVLWKIIMVIAKKLLEMVAKWWFMSRKFWDSPSNSKIYRFLMKTVFWRLLLKLIILRRPQHFAKSPPIIWLALHRTNNWWRFRKILGPSQNIWTFLINFKNLL